MISFVFGLGILLSQFYFFSSGLPQPSHFLIAATFFYILLTRRHVIVMGSKEIALRYMYILVFYVIFINLFYAAIHEDIEFFVSSVYIAFGLMTFLLTKKIVNDIDPDFFVVGYMALLGLIILFILSLLGLGDYRFYPRYNAYFNDPNQMAFWVLCISAALLVSDKFPKTVKVVIIAVCFYILLKSASRSAFLGFGFMIFGYFFSIFSENGKKINGKTLGVGIILMPLSIAGIYYIFYSNSDLTNFMVGRLELIDAAEQADIRGYSRLFEFPQFLIFGSGHGYDLRFNPEGKEIHSTLAGLLFYYGFIGFAFFIFFLYSIFARLFIYQKLIFLAPLMYSLSTFGFRTPIFWFYLGCFYVLALKNRNSMKKGNF